MSYTLGSTTLPRPKLLKREIVEFSRENITIQGTTKKNYISRKNQWILTFQNLTQAQVNNILSEYELNEVRTFTVNEDNLTVGPIDVLIDISDRFYPDTAEQYRENFDLILTEVT